MLGSEVKCEVRYMAVGVRYFRVMEHSGTELLRSKTCVFF